jgi:hypothetical protein
MVKRAQQNTEKEQEWVSPRQAQKMLAERGIKASYQTVVEWARLKRFAGAELRKTLAGEIWHIPLESVQSFVRPKRGRPKDSNSGQAAKTRASKPAGTKKTSSRSKRHK